MQLNHIITRNDFHSGDLGYIIYLHGKLYREEYNYTQEFELYVAKGLLEFFENYDLQKDRIWICEYENKIIGSLACMHRENNAAQVRFFLITPQLRGLGLGKMLMKSFLNFLEECKYNSCFLWTTEEQKAAAALYKKSGFILEQRYDLRIK